MTPPRGVQAYARLAGILLLLSIGGGSFGEVYVPSRIVVSGDVAATAKNLGDSGLLFRIGFASYLLEAVCDIALALLFYALLRPVHRDLALLAAFFGLVSTSVFAAAKLVYFGGPTILASGDSLSAFSPEQVNALTLLSLRFYGVGSGIFMVFYGLASVLRGYLIFRSGYLPKLLGALLILGGLGFVTRNLVLVLAPTYISDVFLLPMFVATVSLTVWLLVKGVDVPKWQAAAQKDGAT